MTDSVARIDEEEFKFQLREEVYTIDLIEAEMAMDSEPILMDQLDANGMPEPNRYVPLFQKWLTSKHGISVSYGQAFKLMERIRYAYLDFKKKFNSGLTLEYASAATHLALPNEKSTSLEIPSPEFEPPKS